MSYVSYLVFFSTLLAVGGVFFYQLTLEAQLQGLKQDLVEQKNLFNQNDLDRVRNLDTRIDAATLLINSHASLLTIFNALAENVADPVQFLSFNYDRREDARTPKLALSAIAKNFDEVIFQKKIFTDAQLTNNLFVNSVSLTTQPVDQERLELGVEQVVNLNMSVELALSDINFTGFTARPADGGGSTVSSQPIGDDVGASGNADETDATTDTINSDTVEDVGASADTVDTPNETPTDTTAGSQADSTTSTDDAF